VVIRKECGTLTVYNEFLLTGTYQCAGPITSGRAFCLKEIGGTIYVKTGKNLQLEYMILKNDIGTNTGNTGNSFWQQTSNGIYYNGGNVGIGKTLPQAALDVNGDIKASGSVQGSQLCIGDDCRRSWIGCDWSGWKWVHGDEGSEDDVAINCVSGVVTFIKKKC